MKSLRARLPLAIALTAAFAVSLGAASLDGHAMPATQFNDARPYVVAFTVIDVHRGRAAGHRIAIPGHSGVNLIVSPPLAAVVREFALME
jgi:hypothetical protein